MDWMEVFLDEVGIVGAGPQQGLQNLKKGFGQSFGLCAVHSTSMCLLPINTERLKSSGVEGNSSCLGQGLHVAKTRDQLKECWKMTGSVQGCHQSSHCSRILSRGDQNNRLCSAVGSLGSQGRKKTKKSFSFSQTSQASVLAPVPTLLGLNKTE